MRIHLAATTALLLLLTACSTPTFEVPSATVKLAPPVTQPPATAAPTTIARTADELEIERVITIVTKAYFVNLTSDKSQQSIEDLITVEHKDLLTREIDTYRAQNKRLVLGSLNDVLVRQIEVSSDRLTATAHICLRNNHENWDTKATADQSDDEKIDAPLEVSSLNAQLENRGGTWLQRPPYGAPEKQTLCVSLF
jgi:hypothetical protein